MSFLSNRFSPKRPKPRKYVSRSPLKLGAEEIARELGPKYQTIDLQLADGKVSYDMNHAQWNSAGEGLAGGVSGSSAQKIRKQVNVLQEENNMLKLKVEVLLNLVAESIAELNPPKK